MICAPDMFYQIPEWDGNLFFVFGFGSENVPRIIKSLRHVKVSDGGPVSGLKNARSILSPAGRQSRGR